MSNIIVSLQSLGLSPTVSAVVVAVAFVAIGVSVFDLAFSLVRIVIKNWM